MQRATTQPTEPGHGAEAMQHVQDDAKEQPGNHGTAAAKGTWGNVQTPDIPADTNVLKGGGPPILEKSWRADTSSLGWFYSINEDEPLSKTMAMTIQGSAISQVWKCLHSSLIPLLPVWRTHR